MDAITIRAVANSDFDIWHPLWKSYQSFYSVEIPESVTITNWERFLDPKEKLHAAIAVSGARALGLVHCVYHYSTWTTDEYCYLQDLYVAEGERSTGVGRALINYVYADAATRGTSRVYWLTHETNLAARALYDSVAERTGFIQYRKQLT